MYTVLNSFSFVFYYGKENWTGPESVAELFGNFDLYVDLALKIPFLINLSKKQFNELKEQGAAERHK